MQSGGISVGMEVRYLRTGTTGRVVRLAEEQGGCFAELDSTHLLYRVDQLVGAHAGARKAAETGDREDMRKTLEKEKQFATSSEFQETLKNIDQSCEGGG